MKDKQDLPLKKDEKSSINTRRSFFKKAALGGSLIATVSSRPVWAGQCSLSGNLSNNSSHHDENEICSLKGYSPNFWQLNSGFMGTTSWSTALTDAGSDPQVAAYILNFELWEAMLNDCDADPNMCSGYWQGQGVHSEFYYPVPVLPDSATLALINILP